LVGLFLLCFGFSGCDKEEPIPAYIHISSVIFNTNEDGSEGSNAHDILDAWVYVNNKLIGAFELPATIPILSSGKQQLTIVAGVKNNGFTAQRIRYPFYKAYDIDIELVPGSVDTVVPLFTYSESLNFQWLEDFEDQTISMKKSGSGTNVDTMSITGLPNDVYAYDGVDNNYSGKVVLGQGFQKFENSTISNFDLPRKGQEIYLEINFKCNTEFVVGIYPINAIVVTGVPIVNLFSTVDEEGIMQWKKAYVSLKEDVNNPGFNGSDFRVFLNVQTNTASGTPLVFFDNIKLVHF